MEEAQNCEEWPQREFPGPASFYSMSCPGQTHPLPPPCACRFSSSLHFFLSLSPVFSPSEYTFSFQNSLLTLRLSMTTLFPAMMITEIKRLLPLVSAEERAEVGRTLSAGLPGLFLVNQWERCVQGDPPASFCDLRSLRLAGHGDDKRWRGFAYRSQEKA